MDSAEKVQMSAAWLGPSNVEFRMGNRILASRECFGGSCDQQPIKLSGSFLDEQMTTDLEVISPSRI
jgi:hypothetical protein